MSLLFITYWAFRDQCDARRWQESPMWQKAENAARLQYNINCSYSSFIIDWETSNLKEGWFFINSQNCHPFLLHLSMHLSSGLLIQSNIKKRVLKTESILLIYIFSLALFTFKSFSCVSYRVYFQPLVVLQENIVNTCSI